MKVIIAGGGTGGHLFPGIAVAEELVARGHSVRFVGTEKGIEARAVPKAGYALDLIDIAGIKAKGFKGTLSGLWRVPRAMRQSRAILVREKPDVVVGVGGYASGPMVLAAALSRRPTAILEQNSIPGFTNRTLGKFVKVVFGAFKTAESAFAKDKYRLVGNPVRKPVRDALAHAGGGASDGDGVLVVGGSQGAHAVNELVFNAMKLLAVVGQAPRLVHQTGEKDRDEYTRRYAEAGIAADVRAFIDDMGAAYRDARVVLARAGASTLAELTMIGKPAILIPFPFAADDHQTVNARELADAGAARLLVQATTSPTELAESMRALLEDSEARTTMAAASRALGRPRAHVEIADANEALARPQGQARLVE
jgi:UDP-N-acetylglucosamine--N-acetylmuramyl-(pentapeptide) pyrophosphoryl-undecaprenol N-acetylglucosamine transferase